MDGLYNRKIHEPIFKEHLQNISDAELAREARSYVFMCNTALNGPWAIDEWKRKAIQEESCRRGRPEIYQEAERFILESLSRQRQAIADSKSD